MMMGRKNKWQSLPEVLTALRNVSSFQRTGQKNLLKIACNFRGFMDPLEEMSLNKLPCGPMETRVRNPALVGLAQ